MCLYCTMNEGWSRLLEYDDVYQSAQTAAAERESNYGFEEEWDELREQVTPSGTGR
jgi:hypothetical protein